MAADSVEGVHLVITPEGEIHGVDCDANRELVRRIQACVNACDGITTEELEQGIVDDMKNIINQVAPILKKANELPRRESA
ncbi:hypothetical protein [Calycomorphotria hydatis]|uniref:Uncharacterized protein n=1 Tax=Calycomorphotria hydatis TaxID=2528027 RepID=A0A517T5M1_9PLAN|nr:hypothetical protein [Calycomorphotria hydatis]QDT63658.1 hypothetical protein V22_08820 [Calycomorphotria hydatis]